MPVATLVPHVHPWAAPGFPPYSLGARLPRTRAGALGVAALRPRSWRAGSSRAGASTTTAARGSGSAPLPGLHTGLSRALTLVGTLPQLEYPRRWAPWLRVVGPLLWEPPGERGRAAAGRRARSCWSRPRRRRTPSTRCCARRSPAWRGRPVRVIATYNGREPSPPVAVPANAVLVPWLSYARSMPACDVVVTHGGHGTLVRALSCGCPVVVCPAGGDMAENAARADWAGVGRPRCRGGCSARARCGSRSARARRPGAARAGPRRRRVDGRATTARRPPRASSRRGAAAWRAGTG